MSRRKTTIKLSQMQDVFILFDEAYKYFCDVIEGFASFHGQIGLMEYCADYIANEDLDDFVERTEMEFGFERKDVKIIIKNYKKTLKELWG